MTAIQVKERPQRALSVPKPKGDKPKRAFKRRSTAEAIEFIDIAKLHVSKLNMRHGKAEPDIEDIYPSILASGVNQSLLVRKEGKDFGVIAGRRRLFALKRKADETGEAVDAPCIVMASGNVAAAKEASLLENIARLPATELEQFAAFKGLAEAGRSSADIAEQFGLTEQRVARVLALANVEPAILKLYEEDEIGRETLRYMTMASEAQQAAWLELWNGPEHAPQHSYLKDWLTGGASISTKAALFNLEDYAGHIIADLFGGQGYFQDVDLFWEHQNRAIAAHIETLKSDGWQSVALLERGEYFARYEHGQRDKEAGGRVYIQIGHDGSVTTHEGWLPQSDIKKIDRILGLEGGEGEQGVKAVSTKPEMSGPLEEYVRLHRHGAIRASLLDSPSIALRVTVAHMLIGSHLWSCTPARAKSRKESTSESVAASPNAARVETERQEVLNLIGLSEATATYGEPSTIVDGSFAQVFAALLARPDDVVMRVMTLAMSLTLALDAEVVETIGLELKPDMSALWTPDDAFFDILRDKRVINAMLKDIGGKSFADGLVSETGTKQKAALRNRFEGVGVSEDLARGDWRPRWMQDVPTHYLDPKTCPLAQAAANAKKALRPKV